jgi:hypothetical protein
MTAKPALRDVTICAADSAFVDLTARALKRSMDQCTFGDAILFSDRPVDGPFRSVEIAPLKTIGAYSRFCLHRLADYIETPFVLIVQWDGYVINPAAWANTFRKYDYIGAAWHGIFPPGTQLVGNGGFSLRSRKLLQSVKTLPPLDFEDRVICHIFGKQLERDSGIRFAPVKVADRFSYQFTVPESLPFGFHGLEHLWRHSTEEELVEIANKADFSKLNDGKLLALVCSCRKNGTLAATTALYAKFRATNTLLKTLDELKRRIGEKEAAIELTELERLIEGHAPV